MSGEQPRPSRAAQSSGASALCLLAVDGLLKGLTKAGDTGQSSRKQAAHLKGVHRDPPESQGTEVVSGLGVEVRRVGEGFQGVP